MQPAFTIVCGDVAIRYVCLVWVSIQDKGILTHVAHDFLFVSELFLPFVNTVIRGLILESLQYCLVLNRDLEQFLLPNIPVQTSPVVKRYSLKIILPTWMVEHGFVSLHDATHLLQQYAVLSFNLSVPPCCFITSNMLTL